MSGGNLRNGSLRAGVALTTAYAGYKVSQQQAHSIQDRFTKTEELPHVRVGILATNNATSSQAVFDAIKRGELNASVGCLITNNSKAYALERARLNGADAIYVPPLPKSDKKRTKEEYRDEYHAHVTRALKAYDVEVLLLVGYDKIVPPSFVAQWTMYNVHPSLLPKHGGLYDLEVHKAVLAAGDKESGATIHQVTDEVDGGPVILQWKCPVDANETPESLKKKVQALEGPMFVDAVKKFAAQKLALADKEQLNAATKDVMDRVMMRNCPFLSG